MTSGMVTTLMIGQSAAKLPERLARLWKNVQRLDTNGSFGFDQQIKFEGLRYSLDPPERVIALKQGNGQ